MKIKKIIITVLCIIICISVISCNSDNKEAKENQETDGEINQTSTNAENDGVNAERYLISIFSYDDYLNFTKDTDLPDTFVHYKSLKEVGDFRSLIILSDYRINDYSEYMYTLTDETGSEINLYVDEKPDEEVSGATAEHISDVNEGDMTKLSSEVSGRFTKDGMTYKYIKGKLLSIEWISEEIEYTLCGNTMLGDYPNVESTFVGKLLNLQTASATLGSVFDVATK